MKFQNIMKEPTPISNNITGNKNANIGLFFEIIALKGILKNATIMTITV